MGCISEWKSAGERDLPVWSSEIRQKLTEEADVVSLVIRLTCADEIERDFPCRLPSVNIDDDADYAIEWFSSQLFNMLSVYSASKVTVYYTAGENRVKTVLNAGIERFRTVPGYCKLLKIARRVTGKDMIFEIQHISVLPEMKKAHRMAYDQDRNVFSQRLAHTLQAGARLNGCGIDVGGTDIKLAASWKGQLIAVKEFDWNPAGMKTAEELVQPIILLTALMSACLTAAANDDKLPFDALKCEADEACMMAAVQTITERHGNLLKFDGIGLSFPDIVIHDRILGGETSKTIGIRNNADVNYEKELEKIAGLNEILLHYANQVRAVNDGHMAAFTTAVERFAGGDVPQGAVCAHSMGTDLGSGWLSYSGAAPLYPFECCNLIFDLGSFVSKKLPAKDVRSVLNGNYNLPVAAKYLGQAAAFRLAFKDEPELISDFILKDGDIPMVQTAPKDLRKPCLEKIMNSATEGDESARNVFRQIGVYLAHITEELEFLAPTGTNVRTLYGRFIKNIDCFQLLQEGFRTVCPSTHLVAADDSLACSALMKQLSAFPRVTVAQFAQAVGAVYYAFY